MNGIKYDINTIVNYNKLVLSYEIHNCHKIGAGKFCNQDQ